MVNPTSSSLSDTDECYETTRRVQFELAALSVATAVTSNAHLSSLRTAVGNSKRPLWDANHPDFVSRNEESVKLPLHPNSKLVWGPTRIVTNIRMNGRQPSFEKHTERIVPNAWRRHGTLAALHNVGGWTNQRNKGSSKRVKRGETPPPKAPNCIQMSLHRDAKPAGNRRSITFRVPEGNATSTEVARALGSELEERLHEVWSTFHWYEPQRVPAHILSHLGNRSSKKSAPRTSVSSEASTCSTAHSGRFPASANRQ